MSKGRIGLLVCAVGVLAAVFFCWRSAADDAAQRALISLQGLAQVDGDEAHERIIVWDAIEREQDRGEESLVEAVDQDGSVLWSTVVPGAEFPNRADRVVECAGTLVLALQSENFMQYTIVLLGLDPKSGEERWRWTPGEGEETSCLGEVGALCEGGLVHTMLRRAADDQTWYAFDPKTGEQRWEVALGSSPSAPFAMGNGVLASVTREERRAGVVVDAKTGRVTDIPREGWAKGGGDVSKIVRDGETLKGVVFSDDHESHVLAEWRVGATEWTPISAAVVPRSGSFVLTRDYALVLVKDVAGIAIVGIPQREGVSPLQISVPQGGPAPPSSVLPGATPLPRWMSTRLKLPFRRESLRWPAGATSMRYVPLVLENDDQLKIIIVDTQEGTLTWSSEWVPKLDIIGDGKIWRHDGATFVSVSTAKGAHHTVSGVDAWVGFDGATGKSLGAWGYRITGTGDAPPMHRKNPSLPRPSQLQGSVLHDFYWTSAVSVDTRSGADGWKWDSCCGQVKIEDRTKDVEAVLGALP